MKLTYYKDGIITDLGSYETVGECKKNCIPNQFGHIITHYFVGGCVVVYDKEGNYVEDSDNWYWRK